MSGAASKVGEAEARYQSMFGDVSRILDDARGSAARSVNAVMTAAYWLIGRHVVEFEQQGKERADYGGEIIERLSADLAGRYGRGFSARNVWQMRAFCLAWPILQTASAESDGGAILPTMSAESSLLGIAPYSLLHWSAHARLLTIKNSVDLLFIHRRLRGPYVIDLKIGRFTHVDAGQMHLYLDYAREHWVYDGENPPVGPNLSAQKDETIDLYALDGPPNKVMADEHRTALSDKNLMAAGIDRTRQALGVRGLLSRTKPKTPPESLRTKATPVERG